MDSTRLDAIPLWAMFIVTVMTVFVAVEIGYQLGRYRRLRSEEEKEAPVGAIVGATLGLLAFMLAFTFSLAAARFDARRMVVLDESNAIGTTFLRAGMLPEPYASETRKLLIRYVDVRLHAVESGEVEQGLTESSELHQALWKQATEAASNDSHSIVTGLFIQSLNEVIDLHSKRVMFALRNRIPEVVWLALYFIAVCAMGALGYQEGLARSRRSLAVLALMLTFSAVILLIAMEPADTEKDTRGFRLAMIPEPSSLVCGGGGSRPGPWIRVASGVSWANSTAITATNVR